MTFDDILEQVITLLQRQGRMSYRALKLRFNLDDEYLDVLKEELIDAQRIATDEDGRILVWTGQAEGVPLSASPSLQVEQQRPAQHDQPTQIAPPLEPHTQEAERRQLTVMFCDLVDSTKLSSQLDLVEELTKALLESGHLQDVDGRYELTGTLPALAIPATLQDSLMARLDYLITAKGVAQLASIFGRQCSYALLHTLSHMPEADLQRELRRLVEAELLYQRGLPPHATYAFKHALIQDAAYQSLLKSTRQQYHQRIAQVLETQFPETAETQPELVAHHLTEAGLTEQSVTYWYKAGQRAIQRSAHVEAINHLRTGLALLQTLPETPERSRQELLLLIALGASLRATQSFAMPEIQATYTRARQLCQHIDNPQQLFPVLRGLHGYYNVRPELQTAYGLGEQLLALAQQVRDPAVLMMAHRALGLTLFWRGVPAAAHTHFVQVRALYDPQQHRPLVSLYGEDVGVYCHSQDAWTLWYLGYPDQGLAQSQEALALAQQLAHPYNLSFAFVCAAMFHQLRRDVRGTQERAEAALSVAQEQRFPFWMANSAILDGWARAHRGQTKAGMAQITHGLVTYRATGAEICRPYYLALLADAYGLMGQQDAGLELLKEALTLADTTGERWYDPELYRLQGALLLQQNSDHEAEAEPCFHHALEIARTQQAKSFELRTATSLARLWQQQGKRQEAYDLLAPVYHWFTEGFDTADLQDAKALLEELA
jgi:predicted ATPase